MNVVKPWLETVGDNCEMAANANYQIGGVALHLLIQKLNGCDRNLTRFVTIPVVHDRENSILRLLVKSAYPCLP